MYFIGNINDIVVMSKCVVIPNCVSKDLKNKQYILGLSYQYKTAKHKRQLSNLDRRHIDIPVLGHYLVHVDIHKKIIK